MAKKNQSQIFELYRLHAELSDRVSQRREGVHRLFVSLFTGLLVFLGAFLQFGTGDLSANAIVFFVVAGAMLSAVWFLLVLSYQQLNKGKFKVLIKMEKRLAYAFFKREWKVLGKGKDSRRYRRLTQVEKSIPIVFLVLFVFVSALVLAVR